MVRNIPFLLLSIVMFLAACDPSMTGPGASRNKTEAEIALERDAAALAQTSRNIVVRNAAQGAAAGALLAGFGTALMGGDMNDMMRNAAIGAAVGGAGGAAVGSAAARTNEVQEQQRQLIAQLNQTEAGLNDVQRQLNAVIAAQNREIAALRGQSSDQAKARLAAINANRAAVQRSLERTDDRLEKTSGDLVSLEQNSGVSTNAARSKTNSMRGQIARMANQASPVRVTN